jgi:hypothetical protein
MIKELIADSAAGLALDESETYRGTHLTEDQASEAADLVRQNPDHTRYHLLMALRRDHPGMYQRIPAAARASILTTALTNVRWLNDFGYLDPGGSWDGPAAAALIETGKDAEPALRHILADRSPAPLRGSEMATMAHLYHYRRGDYAVRYLAVIAGQDPVFDPDPVRRDKRIAELRGGF